MVLRGLRGPLVGFMSFLHHFSGALALLAFLPFAHAQPTPAPSSRDTGSIFQAQDEGAQKHCKALQRKIEQARNNPGNEANRVVPPGSMSRSQRELARQGLQDNRHAFERQWLEAGCDAP